MFRSGDKYWVPAGALLGLEGAQIKNHIFVADKAEWDHIGGNGAQHSGFYAVSHNKPLKFVPATKCVASTGLANARRLAERYMLRRVCKEVGVQWWIKLHFSQG